MTESKEDYSIHIEIFSNIQHVFSVFAGFVVTIMTLLVTLLPDPSDILAQTTLFILNLTFDLLVFVLVWNIFGLRRFSKLPQGAHLGSVRAGNIQDALTMLAFCLFGITISLMFLLINLPYLALASGIMWLVLVVASWFVMWKPYRELHKLDSPAHQNPKNTRR